MQKSRGRRLAARVTARGVIVRIPAWTSPRAAEMWLAEVMPKLEQRLARTPFHLIQIPREIHEGASIRILDNEFQILCEEKPRSFVNVSAETICLSGPSRDHRKRALKRRCMRWLRDEAEPVARLFAKNLGVSFEELIIRNYRSRLGACSSDGRLHLHWGIVFLPRPHREAVIAHEVAHIREPHHRADFWKTVEYLAPGAHALHRDIRRIGPFLSL